MTASLVYLLLRQVLQMLTQLARDGGAKDVLIAGERHLAAVLGGYTAHDNAHRPHRALGQRPPEPRAQVTHVVDAKVRRRPVRDGLINEYQQAA
ncbi:MAG: hypothetical protein ABW156_11180 [Jiangellaceae bacterium]